jgi:ribosome-associated protein
LLISYILTRNGREEKPLESKDKALEAARAALDKKAKDILILDLNSLTTIAEYFVICSGESTTQVKAITELIKEKFDEAGIKPLGIEGLNYSHWVLMDYGDVIIHIFEEETRTFYELEKLWIDAGRVQIA